MATLAAVTLSQDDPRDRAWWWLIGDSGEICQTIYIRNSVLHNGLSP